MASFWPITSDCAESTSKVVKEIRYVKVHQANNLSYSLGMFGDGFKVVLTKGICNVRSHGDQ